MPASDRARSAAVNDDWAVDRGTLESALDELASDVNNALMVIQMASELLVRARACDSFIVGRTEEIRAAITRASAAIRETRRRLVGEAPGF